MQSNSDAGAGFWLGLAILALVGWAFGWWGKSDEWTGYVYTTADMENFYKIGPFETFEDCQQSSISSLRGTGRAAVGTYECGLNCKIHTDMSIDICEETRD